MLGRFGAEPPRYRHQQAEEIPLVSGIEATMAWLDLLAVRHGWVTDYIGDDLINAGGFNWYRYTGGVGEKELFVPRLTAPFELDGYPHNVSGIFDQFKEIEKFVGYRLGQDWTDSRWGSTYNSDSDWEEPNLQTNHTTDGVQPLFESGLKFGKWQSEGFNSLVYDGGASDPDITWYGVTLSKAKRFYSEVPWTIIEEGPELIYDSGQWGYYHNAFTIPGSGWLQHWRYKSSGQPTDGTVVNFGGVQNTADAQDTLTPGSEVFDYWSNVTVSQGHVAAHKNIDFRAEALAVSGFTTPRPAYDPVDYSVDDPVVWLNDPAPIDTDYPQHANTIVTSEVRLSQGITWGFIDLRSQVAVPGDSFDDQVQYHNPQKLYGYSSSDNFPFGLYQKWQTNLSDLFTGNMDTNSYYTAPWFATGSGQVNVDYSSTHCLAYHAFNDRDIITSGGNPITYNFIEPGGLLLSDIYFAISGYFKDEFTDLDCYTVPKMLGAEKYYTGYPIPDTLLMSGNAGGAFINGVNEGGNNKKRLGILLYTKEPWELPPEFPATGTISNAPFTTSTTSVLYYWSGRVPADGAPDYYGVLKGVSAPVKPWPPSYNQGLANVNGIVSWVPAGVIPDPGGAGFGFVNKDLLARQAINNYVSEIQAVRNPRVVSLFPTTIIADVPGIISTRSTEPRWIQTSGLEVDTGSEYNWNLKGNPSKGITIGVDDAPRTQPSGGTTYGFYA
jgi:hypothetical protein